ncbi:hypothetical protein RND81_01G172100 [Saponaria officinalis]|uniref:Uncharacterized protein n=1 Tax=Saponaria officinalis TaxID=3572 RepID=A0AAW1NAH2_SAPOF
MSRIPWIQLSIFSPIIYYKHPSLHTHLLNMTSKQALICVENVTEIDQALNNVVPSVEYDFDIYGSLLGQTQPTWKSLYEMYHKHSQTLGFSIRLGTCPRVARPDSPEFKRYLYAQIKATTLVVVEATPPWHRAPLTMK